MGVELGLQDLDRGQQVLLCQFLVPGQQVAYAPYHGVEGMADALKLIS